MAQSMIVEDARQGLDRLIRERGETYGSVSHLLGRNPTYVQQFIKRGVPRRLDELDRRKLAAHFNVDEAVLGGLPATTHSNKLSARFSGRTLPLIDGSGDSPFTFDEKWLCCLTSTSPARLTVLRAQGDVMYPTLGRGDHVIIDPTDGRENLRDGLYAIDISGTVQVRRITIDLRPGCVTVGCDNAVYPSWPNCRIDDLTLVGRIAWIGRKLA